MNAVTRSSSIARLFASFSPASRAAIVFVVPFTILDAIHYYTAGTALLLSFPLVAFFYLLCGAVAAGYAHRLAEPAAQMPRVGRLAGLRLWLASTVINVLLAVILGIGSLGAVLVVALPYLCLSAPLHALGSALGGWLGAWLYMQYIQRVPPNEA